MKNALLNFCTARLHKVGFISVSFMPIWQTRIQSKRNMVTEQFFYIDELGDYQIAPYSFVLEILMVMRKI